MDKAEGKLLIVDGSNLLFQMFYGMPARMVNKEGKPIHGTIGFVGALLKIIRMTKPTHVVVFFDGECQNERKCLDEGYKANRPDFSQMPEEETPFSQLPDIYKALDLLKLRYMETTTCETDDLVAAYALRFGGQMQVIISSFDSDFFQLITDMVSVFRYRGENSVLCDVAYVQEKLGVNPCQYADYKCLVGDSADNIKGIKGVGPKTAASLLSQFGCLDTLLQNTAQIAKPSIRKAIEEGRGKILLNRRLICLCGCREIPYPIEELVYAYKGERTRDILAKIGL